MKISILCPNISGNGFGRAYVLARLLQRRYEVEIVGCAFGDGIWPPMADLRDVCVKFVRIKQIPMSYWNILQAFRQEISGDVIYASKPVLASFGVGLLRKRLEKKPLVLDIDDYERGFVREKYSSRSFGRNLLSWARAALYFHEPYSYWSCLACEKAVHLADEITVSNKFLHKKFGGTIIYHARDTKVFDPALFDKAESRRKYHIEQSKRVVLFAGTPGRHKGLEDLIEAVRLVDDENVILFVVGIDERKKECRALTQSARELLGSRFVGTGFASFGKLPEILSLADVVVIPQRKNLASVGQLPAKIFDAMAIAKAIIATGVAELPEILAGCGWIAEPGNPSALAESIRDVLSDTRRAKQRGRKAREKCIEKYSYEAMENLLCGVFAKYQ